VSGSYQVVQSETAGVLAGHLFVDPPFVAYQAGAQHKRTVSFAALGPDGTTLACLTLAGGQDAWTSPITGAFGGAAVAGDRTPGAAIFEVAEAATRWLRAEGAARAVVRLAPDAFGDPAAASLENALFRNGWRLEQADINYHLPITSPEAFLKQLGETKQKEIRRLHRSGSVFRALPAQEGRRAYEAIAENRAARGFPMTMSWTQVAALAAALPEAVTFRTVERDEAVLAGAVCLQVTPAYAYVFYWGEAAAFRKESPVLMLAEGLIAEHHRRGSAVLDLGTSTEQSVPNAGLIAFKEGLGCRTSSKRTYVLDPS
jgi:hypothetical protein